MGHGGHGREEPRWKREGNGQDDGQQVGQSGASDDPGQALEA